MSAAAPRSRALLVTPILPARAGNGLAMRAGTFLEALAGEHEVTLLLVPLAGAGEPDGFVLERTGRVVVLPLDSLDPLYLLSASSRDPAERLAALAAYPKPRLCRWATTPVLQQAAALVGPEAFEVVVVLRSYLAPYAAPFLGAPLRVLDLDDDERLTHQRLGEMQAVSDRGEQVALSLAEARKYTAHERQWLPRFDRILASSEIHEAAVRARLAEEGAKVEVGVVPNSVAVPESVVRAPRSEALRLLFVGNLGYEPNIDAALWLARELMPELRSEGRRVELTIAGSHPAEVVVALAGKDVQVRADPQELAPLYAEADAALAPIRAGGGTRIKILEAFAHRVPVVATKIGAEGIAAQDGVHLLLAETAAEFAAACGRLGEGALSERLTRNAFALVRERYARERVVRVIRERIAPLQGAGAHPGPPTQPVGLG